MGGGTCKKTLAEWRTQAERLATEQLYNLCLMIQCGGHVVLGPAVLGWRMVLGPAVLGGRVVLGPAV